MRKLSCHQSHGSSEPRRNGRKDARKERKEEQREIKKVHLLSDFVCMLIFYTERLSSFANLEQIFYSTQVHELKKVEPGAR